MNDVGSTLVAHCGARKVTRDELKEIPTPEGTATHQPLSHFKIVELLEEALAFRHLAVERDEYAVSRDGMKMFGVMDLDSGFEAGNFSIGLRNSNDKSMRLALTAGYRVVVCDNMAFSGDFTPMLHKHTRNLALTDAISIAVDRIHRGFGSLEMQVKGMKEYGLTDNDARLLVYRAFLEREIKGLPRNLMTPVHGQYFEPTHEAFVPRSLWSLSNAFTSAFKQLAPIRRFEVTARLGAFLKTVQEQSRQVSNTSQDRQIEGEFYPFMESEGQPAIRDPWNRFIGPVAASIPIDPVRAVVEDVRSSETESLEDGEDVTEILKETAGYAADKEEYDDEWPDDETMEENANRIAA